MVSEKQVRAIALGMPEVLEQDHHGFPSFRVKGKIFATLPDSGLLNVMIDPDEVAAAATLNPASCQELWWGKKLSGVQVTLGKADARLVKRLLEGAWQRRAPKPRAKR